MKARKSVKRKYLRDVKMGLLCPGSVKRVF